MKLLLSVLFLSILFLFQSCQTSKPTSQSQETIAIIEAAEVFFNSLLKKDYIKVWDAITEKSKRTIISDVLKYLKAGEPIRGELETEFKEGRGAALSYWDAYLFNFDPNMALKDSKWEVGKVKDDYAEIILSYKKSEKPAILKLYREGNAWKFGLVESFWSRK